jgi:hypothetical protein
MLIPGPGGVMYAAAPADGSQGMQQGAQMSYGMAAGGVQGGYQLASSGMQMTGGGVAAQPQAADPMAYAKLAGYGQQGSYYPVQVIFY